MNEVTRILDALQQGDPHAGEALLPLVYEELRRLAAHKMAREPAGQTLQATALVHEAWLRLAGAENQNWQNRSHFFAAAAEAMRRILIDKARRRHAERHGGGQARVNFEAVDLAAPADDDELLAVNEALEAFTRVDPAAAKLVKLRYFAGLTMPEAAEALGLPQRSAERMWTYARAWLRREMGRASGGETKE